MKNLFFGIIATVLFSISSNAQEKTNFDQKAEFSTATIKTTFNEESISYKFKSLEEFNEGSEKILSESDFNNPDVTAKLDKCEVTIEVTVTVKIGVVSVSMTGSVTTTCAEAGAAAKRLKAMLIAAATS